MASSTAFVFIFVAFIVGVQSCALVFKDCGSKGGKVQSVGFNGTCNAQKAAILKKGTYVQLQISVESGEVTNSLTSVVHGIIGGVPIKFPLGNPNACVSCNITCPVQKDKQYTYAPVIHVLDSYPGIGLIVKWELVDGKKSDFICIKIPVVITS